MKDEKIELNDLPDFEDEVSARFDDASTLSVTDEAPAEEAPIAEEEAPAAPVEKEEAPAPQYGAPQSLFEDIIPAGFSKEDALSEEAPADKEEDLFDKKAEKEAEAARKKAEKDAEKEAKKAEKEAKKKAKTAALIARVEADAVRQAKADIKKESGEDYELPSEKETPVAEEAPAAEEKAPSKKAEKKAAKKKDTTPSKAYTREEKKLRKKYKLTDDLLLSSNTVIPGFVLAKGENVIRSYQCLACRKGEGTLCLTNRRLLVDAGERSEVDIRNVSGIKFRKNTYFSFLKLIFWLISFVVGFGLFATSILYTLGTEMPFVSSFLEDYWQDYFPYLLPVVSWLFIIFSFPLFSTMRKKTFYFYVFAKEDAAFMECKSPSVAKGEKKGKVYKYMVTKAGKESEKAARELGALIIEAKEGRYDFS